MKTTIYLVRHCKVENPLDIVYGWLPHYRLSDEGIEQAKKIQKYFTAKRIDTFYSSSLLRARQTARIIIDNKNIKLNISKLITEWHNKWEGIPKKDRPKKEVLAYYKKASQLKIGETFQGVQNRVLKFLKKIIKKHLGQNIVCVLHADVISTLKLTLEGKSLDLIPYNPCDFGSITKIELENDALKDIKYIANEDLK